MNKLTFKEYCESKKQLVEATNKPAITQVHYTVRKYCKIPVLNEQDDIQYVSLKPKQEILIEWLHEDIYFPQCKFLEFHKVDVVDSKQRFYPRWSKQKLHDWLLNNTKDFK